MRLDVQRHRLDRKASPYVFVAPFFVLFGVFGLYPMAYTLWVSLHDWQLLSPDHPFVGLDNYVTLFGDANFWNAVVNTLGIFVVATVPQLLIALWLANSLNRKIKARTLFRMGVLVPNITSIAAVAIVFGQLFGRDYGLFNWLIGLVGVTPVDWQANTWSSWTAISVMVDWRWTGYNALIFLAAMQVIPRSLYESAELDGASRCRQFWSLTVPMMRPTIIFVSIVSVSGALQLFVEPLLFNQGNVLGGSTRQSQTVVMYMYEKAFRGDFDYGYGSAIGWMLFLIILVIALVNVALMRRNTT
jgi:cellobiose transport system permease protein